MKATYTTSYVGISTTGSAGGSYATPDILDNASFESGWDGFVNGSLVTPSGFVERSTDRGYTGATSLKFAWNNNVIDQGAEVFYDIGASRAHVFARCWFYMATAYPNGSGYKFFRYQDSSLGGISGIQILNGNFCWLDQSSNIIYGGAPPSTDTWHSLEFEMDLTARELRMWVDGSARTWTTKWSDPSNHYTINGETLSFDASAPVITPRYLDINRLINPTTNSGAAYFDRVAVSTQRIGP